MLPIWLRSAGRCLLGRCAPMPWPLKTLLLNGDLNHNLAVSDIKQLFRASTELACLVALVCWRDVLLKLLRPPLEENTDSEDDGDFPSSPHDCPSTGLAANFPASAGGCAPP